MIDRNVFTLAMMQQHKLVAVAPKSKNEPVSELLLAMKLDVVPIHVTVHNESYAKTTSCYYNVQEKIQRNGGMIRYGWAVWQSHYLCEAEHHAIWESPDGTFIDITPRSPHHETIMFIPDDEVSFSGVPIPSYRVNASDNSVIDDLILCCDVLDWTRRYERRLNADECSMPAIVNEYVGNSEKPGPIMLIAHNVELFFLTGNKPHDLCYCNSMKAYEECHKKTNEQHLTIYVHNIIAACGEP